MSGESLEAAQEKTKAFLDFALGQLAQMGLDSGTEPMFTIAGKVIPHLTTLEEHYELREKIGGALSAAAYKTLYRKWRESLILEVGEGAPA